MEHCTDSNYYVKKKTKLMKDYRKVLEIADKVIRQYFDNLTTKRVLEKAWNQYENLIPQIPFIGGKKNSNTMNLIGSAWMLATIRPLEKENTDTRQIGKIIYEIFEKYFSSPFSGINKLSGKIISSKFGLKKMKKSCVKAPFKQYGGGWAKTFVPGDGKTFDFGLDVTECGICAFYKQQNAEKYIPYICLGDYLTFQNLGLGLTRTQTLGNGGSVCDFRIKKSGITKKGWPPDELEEWNVGH